MMAHLTSPVYLLRACMQVGDVLMRGLRQLQLQHADVIGDVRGMGLFVGVDVVKDAASKHHAPRMAK